MDTTSNLFKLFNAFRFFTIITLIVVSFAFIKCGEDDTHESGKKVLASGSANPFVIKDSVFLSMNGYGYDIIINGAVMIHQARIPGIAGTSGFASREDAQKIAHLAIRKIKGNQFPPAISLQELQSSRIIIYDYKSRTGLYKVDM
jgi:hypothetical protein